MHKDDARSLNLAVVMPVYNEEGCIEQVIRSWIDTLASLDATYVMIVLNDGSKDRTADILESLSGLPGLEIMHKTNSGHGPTILEGYRMAVERAVWVFQVDSDDELPHEAFPSLWNQREQYAALFGTRSGREQTLSRRVVTRVSRLAVRVLFGSGVEDVNTPYRLIRSTVLEQAIEKIPEDTFAPNVIVSGAIAHARLPVLNVPIPHRHRTTGTVSATGWRLWKGSFQSLVRAVQVRSTISPSAK